MNRRTTLTVGLVLAGAVALTTAGSAVAARPAGPEPTSPATSTATRTATPTPTATVTGLPTARPTLTRGARAPQLVVAGTLSAVDTAGRRITVTVQGGREKGQRLQDVVLALTPATVLRQDGTVVEAAALRPGGHVQVRFTRAADGSLTATRVTVEGREDTPDGSPASSPASSPTSSPDTAHR